jgi:hypothetical protein
MALSAAGQQFIIDQESEWIDSSLGSIDLSAFPNLQAQPNTESHDAQGIAQLRYISFRRFMIRVNRVEIIKAQAIGEFARRL